MTLSSCWTNLDWTIMSSPSSAKTRLNEAAGPPACDDCNPICEPWQNNLGEIIISRSQINWRVKALGAAISRDYEGQSLVLIGVLRGIFFFMADLLREITVP